MSDRSVIAIDFGNDSCKIATTGTKGVEIIFNEYVPFQTSPSCVAFSDKMRLICGEAFNQKLTNQKNSVDDFKRLLGHTFSEHKKEFDRYPYDLLQLHNDKIGVKVMYQHGEETFNIEQITAMLLTKLVDSTNITFQARATGYTYQDIVKDVILSVPSYYNHIERQALLTAAKISGLNVLRLLNDMAAIALAYGNCNPDIMEGNEARNVVFIDFGSSALQVAVYSFYKDQLKLLSTTSDPQLGGRNFDRMLADHFSEEYMSRFKIDPRNHKNAYGKLLAGVEILKKQMSSVTDTLPLNVEYLLNSLRLTSEMQRSKMESVCSQLLEKVKKTLTKALLESTLSPDDIYSIELTGGATSMPSILNIVREVFTKDPSTTMDRDNSVAYGCAVLSTEYFPKNGIRQLKLQDTQNYSLMVRCEETNHPEEQILLLANEPLPAVKKLIFHQQNSFNVGVYYGLETPYPNLLVAKFFIEEMLPTSDGENNTVIVTVEISMSGILKLDSVKLRMEEIETASNMEEKVEPEVSEDLTDKCIDLNKKKKDEEVKLIDLPFDIETFDVSINELQNYIVEERSMYLSDKKGQSQINVKNALIECIYDIREKLNNPHSLMHFVSAEQTNAILNNVQGVEDWLYSKNNSDPESIFKGQLQNLQDLLEPASVRKSEYDERCILLDELYNKIQQNFSLVDGWYLFLEECMHLHETEVKTLRSETERYQVWLHNIYELLSETPLYENPPVTVEEIKRELSNFLIIPPGSSEPVNIPASQQRTASNY